MAFYFDTVGNWKVIDRVHEQYRNRRKVMVPVAFSGNCYVPVTKNVLLKIIDDYALLGDDPKVATLKYSDDPMDTGLYLDIWERDSTVFRVLLEREGIEIESLDDGLDPDGDDDEDEEERRYCPECHEWVLVTFLNTCPDCGEYVPLDALGRGYGARPPAGYDA